ncbi:hypothetical protein N7533_005071 [Penicillium manginii]|uniref:uncharacterized protein n=1 Tax=Penicillium manginii TaxID=203109 RepID=UPI002548BBBF|nr:uncharacterized protein N7533_005071 [Penicillium manginii]KAJ5755528.1 hypothetical protein N7533_005071 [Penicillium manginii]
MSDSSSKSPSIPSWQRQSGAAPADQSSSSSSSPSPSPSSDDAPAPTNREDLLTQAAKFLEDESIRDSPTDRKVTFLESKGLNSDEIDQLLGITRNAEATSTTPTAAESKTQETPSTPSSGQSEVTPSSPATAQSSPNTTSQPRSTAPSTTPASAPRDVPPIITYPEFLFEANKPPPLVTMNRVLYTIYGAAGLGASIYGASEYLVKPMLATLTSARHELASTAQENLTKLNEKLEKSVTVIPAHLTARKTTPFEDESDDTDSVTSDPTELFHRDMGTQTSPETTESSIAAIEKESKAPDAPTQAVNNHMSRLESIQSQLKEVNGVDKDSSALEDELRNKLTDLHHYLDGLTYAAPSYSSSTPSYGLYSSTTNGTDSAAMGVKKSEDEAIAGFKAEIRGVKGALLSARNFPTSRGGRLGGMASTGR